MPGNRLITHPRSLDSSLQCSATLYVGVCHQILPAQTTEKQNNWCMMLLIMQFFSPLCCFFLGPCALSTPNLNHLQSALCKHVNTFSRVFYAFQPVTGSGIDCFLLRGAIQIRNNFLHPLGSNIHLQVHRFIDNKILFQYHYLHPSILTGGYSRMKLFIHTSVIHRQSYYIG